jgi:hypothetical protein
MGNAGDLSPQATTARVKSKAGTSRFIFDECFGKLKL